MDRTEHLLTVLAEECVEVAKEVSKALRFGLDDTMHVLTEDGQGFRPGDGGPWPTNRERICLELAQLDAMADWLRKEGILPPMDDKYEASYTAKRGRVERFMDYAHSTGALRDTEG